MLLQALQLPARLAAAVFKGFGVKLDTCLSQLPSRLQAAGLCTFMPEEVSTDGVQHIYGSSTVYPQVSARTCTANTPCTCTPCTCTASTPILQALLKTAARITQLSAVHLGVERVSSEVPYSSRQHAGCGESHQATAKQCGTHGLAAVFKETLTTLPYLKALHFDGVFREACMLSAVASMLHQLPLLESLGGKLFHSPEVTYAASWFLVLQ